MTFEEFLISNEMVHQFNGTNILKIKYNDTIDFLYVPSYGKYEYNSNLKFIGLFDREHQNLYGSSYYLKYAKEYENSYYKGDMIDLEKALLDDASTLLNEYIIENKGILMELSKDIFDKYIQIESNKSEINFHVITNYIYSKNDDKSKFSISEFNDLEKKKKLIISYIQNPQRTAQNLFEDYINKTDIRYSSFRCNNQDFKLSKKEIIGLELLVDKYKTAKIQELKENPNYEYKKKHDIISSIKDLNAQMITLTLKHNGETIDIKYPKKQLYNFFFSTWYIPNLQTREIVKDLYSDIGGYSDFLLEDIVSIHYNRKTLYEDKELLDNIAEKQEDENNLEAEDEMFD